jgi:photosystem II stability/assembly factor-like uncharacterized protein
VRAATAAEHDHGGVHDGGRGWRLVLELAEGAGPVAWSRSDPKLAYVVGLNRTLYRSGDGGESWLRVGEGS